MKTKGLIRFLALCLAVTSLSMLVSGGLGIRAANKERRKDDSELQDLRSRIDEYREISAALMDRTSYEDLNKTLEEKQKKYDSETAKHRSELTAYTAANTGLEMGTAVLNQAEAALETGKTQYETGRKALKASLNAFNQIYSVIGAIDVQRGTIEDILIMSEKLLRGEEADSSDPHDGSVYKLEQAIRNLGALIENDLPGEEDGDQTDDDTEDGSSSGSNNPGEGTAGGEASPEQNDPPNTNGESGNPDNPGGNGEIPNNPEQNNDLGINEGGQPEEPDNPKPIGEPLAPFGELFSSPDESGTPLSPNTGEEKDLSGRLNDAIREVIRAEQVVQEDVNTITALAESINLPPEVLQTVLGSAGASTADELRKVMIDAIHGSGIVLTPEQGEALGQMLQILSDADEVTGSVTDQMEEIREKAGTVDRNTDEMAEYLDTIMQNADYRFTEDQMRDIRTAYMANQESIEEELGSIEEERKDGFNTVVRAESTAERVFGLLGQLSGAKATLEETLAAMKEVGEQIEEGEAALAEGKAKLNESKDQQKKKAEELDNKKRDLDQQEKALKQSIELAEEQKELEDREKALRTALLSREEIRRRSQYGEELLSASEHWLAEYTDQTAERYRDRFDASLLMIACAMLAFAGALTSFGENRYRVITLLTTLLCLALSISAVLLLQRMGRGISWSATVTAVIAAMELILLIPSMPLLQQADVPVEQGMKQSNKTGTKTARNSAQKKK